MYFDFQGCEGHLCSILGKIWPQKVFWKNTKNLSSHSFLIVALWNFNTKLLHILGKKPVFWFFDFWPFYRVFSIPPSTKIVVFDPPGGQKTKNQKFKKQFFFQPQFIYTVFKFHKGTIKIEWEDRFFNFFSIFHNFDF